VIVSQETAGITAELYQQLIQMLESESWLGIHAGLWKTHRIPVQYMKGFLSFFPFSRNNHNKLYLSTVRIIEIGPLVLLFFVLMPLLYWKCHW
jgi:hypothetical protein